SLTAILTVPSYPFQMGFLAALVLSTAGAGLLGMLLGAPTLRLRGDYLALVTLGFGEVVRFGLRNLEEITGGTRGLNPVPAPALPGWLVQLGAPARWESDYRLFYYIGLAVLMAGLGLFSHPERARAGLASETR